MRMVHALALLVLAGCAGADDSPAIPGATTKKTKNKSDRSTSSSSGEKGGSDSDAKAESLDMSMSGSSSGDSKKDNKYKAKSTAERHGWRKWHRKCTPCPQELELKWRDPRISWICGGYQRARRSFKSLCMMHFRNCQDGTMFVKIHPHRCENSTSRPDGYNWSTNGLQPHGQHFFYDYRVMLSVDSSGTKSSSKSSGSDESESGSGWRRHHPHRRNMQRRTKDNHTNTITTTAG